MFAFEIVAGGAVGVLAGAAYEARTTRRVRVTGRAVASGLVAATLSLLVAAVAPKAPPKALKPGSAPVAVATARTAGARVEAQMRVGPEGGVVAVTDPESPMKGAQIVVPAGALERAETIRIAFKTTLPGPAPKGARVGGPIAVLTKDSPAPFAKPVVVTIPCKAEGEVPTTVYWDEKLERYRPVTLREIDRVNDLVTFDTVHFTDFGTFLFNVFTGGKSLALPNVTGIAFTSSEDGFVMANRGDYLSDGNCIGMSLFEIWYAQHKRAELGPLHDLFNVTSEEFDVVERELASFVQHHHNGFNSWLAEAGGFVTGQAITGVNLINQLRTTNEPQVMILRGKGGAGHAVVVHGYENGHFLIADPNFPGELVTYDFDTLHGFSNYSKEAKDLKDIPNDFYSGITGVTYTSASSLVSDDEMERALTAALDRARNGESATKTDARTEFVAIDVAEGRVTGGLASVTTVTLTGRISNVSRDAKHPVERITAKVGGVETKATINRDGSFSIDVPLPAGTKVEDVTLYANAVITKDGQEKGETYAGQRTFKLRVQSRRGPETRTRGLAGALTGA